MTSKQSRQGLRKDLGGRHQMLNEINRASVLNNLLGGGRVCRENKW